MFVWDVVALDLVAERGTTTTNVPPWVMGPDIINPNIDLWHSSYVTNLVVFVLTVLQAPQYDREISGEHARALESLHSRHAWIPAMSRAVVVFQVNYGTWVVYLAFVAIAIIPGADVMSLCTLVVVGVSLLTHLLNGVHRSTVSVRAMRSVSACLAVMAALQGVFLAARYVFQFVAFADWFTATIGPKIADVLTVTELGLVVNVDSATYSGNLYLSLLDTAALFFVAVMQQRAVNGALAFRLQQIKRERQQQAEATSAAAAQGAAGGRLSMAGSGRVSSPALMLSRTGSGGPWAPGAAGKRASVASTVSSGSRADTSRPLLGGSAPRVSTTAGDGAATLAAAGPSLPPAGRERRSSLGARTMAATSDDEMASAIARWTFRRSPGLTQASFAAVAALMVATTTSVLPLSTAAVASVVVLVVAAVVMVLVHDLRKHGAHVARLRAELRAAEEARSRAYPRGPGARRPVLARAAGQGDAGGTGPSGGNRRISLRLAPQAAVAAGAAGDKHDPRTLAGPRPGGCARFLASLCTCRCRCRGPARVLSRFWRHLSHLARHFLFFHSGKITMVTGFAVATQNVDAMSFCLVALIVSATYFSGFREALQACGGCRRRPALPATAAETQPASSTSSVGGPGAARPPALSTASAATLGASTGLAGIAEATSPTAGGSPSGAPATGLLAGLPDALSPAFHWAWLPLLVGAWSAQPRARGTAGALRTRSGSDCTASTPLPLHPAAAHCCPSSTRTCGGCLGRTCG
jgi:hypothetical protein